MDIKAHFKIERVETKTSKKGAEYTVVEISTYGKTFSMMLPEKLVPDVIEGSEADITLTVGVGAFMKPELRISKVENLQPTK